MRILIFSKKQAPFYHFWETSQVSLAGSFKSRVSLITVLLALVGNTVPSGAQESKRPAASSPMVRALVTNFGGEGVSVIDPERERVVAHIKTGAKPHGVAIAPGFDDMQANTVSVNVLV